MESGHRFELSRHRTPEQELRESLKGEAKQILYRTEDPIAHEIAEKILEKIAIKEHIEEIHRHRDDTTMYQPWKQLGIFIVVDAASKIDWQDESGLEIRKGDKVLDIHLPTLNPKEKTLTQTTASLKMVATYIQDQKLDPKYIMGVTWEKLANASRRQGFTVVDPGNCQMR